MKILPLKSAGKAQLAEIFPLKNNPLYSICSALQVTQHLDPRYAFCNLIHYIYRTMLYEDERMHAYNDYVKSVIMNHCMSLGTNNI